MMTDPVIATVQMIARSWREQAEKRRAISKVDAVADTLEYCASEIAHRVTVAAAVTPTLTVAEYARQHRITEQTVRKYCRTGRLPARLGPAGWEIPADAELVRRSA